MRYEDICSCDTKRRSDNKPVVVVFAQEEVHIQMDCSASDLPKNPKTTIIPEMGIGGSLCLRPVECRLLTISDPQ